jgi:hypothetical protein
VIGARNPVNWLPNAKESFLHGWDGIDANAHEPPCGGRSVTLGGVVQSPSTERQQVNYVAVLPLADNTTTKAT